MDNNTAFAGIFLNLLRVVLRGVAEEHGEHGVAMHRAQYCSGNACRQPTDQTTTNQKDEAEYGGKAVKTCRT